MQYWLLQLALELEERLNKDRDQVGIMLSNQCVFVCVCVEQTYGKTAFAIDEVFF